MSLASGTKLGPYKILSPLGAGGMGEVYKAKDTRLDRTVAIKVLPSHLSDNARLKERFEREARAVSSLNHPHICTLFDVGSENGVDFMVMEHIEGETLADRLKKGALTLDQALCYGVEIADALDKAHRKGVVHRDLKPGNIMLTKSGAKLLDFGLAKTAAEQASPGDLSALPTQAKPLTQEGSILGTFQYMAPEQLEGKEADSRTDIFAFGSVLYEMVTGKRAFEGKSQASLIGAIMTSDPPAMSTLQTMTPPLLDHVVKTCLAKDPDERWQAAGDVSRELSWIGTGDAQLRPDRVGPPRLPWAISVLVALALGAFVAWVLSPEQQDSEAVSRRLDIALPSEVSIDGGGRDLPIAISRDGRRIVYVATEEGERRLYLRDFDHFEPRVLSGTDGATNPFFSPNGQWVGFRAGSWLWKVSVDGGAPLEITRVPAGLFGGATWIEGDVIVFSPSTRGGFYRVSANGGEAVPLTILEPDERLQMFPTSLPGGKDFLFTIQTLEGWFAAVASVDTGEHRRLSLAATGAVWFLPSGHLVYGQGGGLLAVPFDLDALEVRGGATPVLDDILTGSTAAIDVANFAISESGSLVYVPGGLVTRSLVWVDRKGEVVPLSPERGIFTYPSLSPDGKRLAVTDDGDIWVYELEGRRARTRLTTEGSNYVPRWSPDGQRIVFGSSQSGRIMSLHEQLAEGGAGARLLLDRAERQYPIGWTPDGTQLLFWEIDPVSGGDILAWSSAQSGQPTPVLTTEFREGSAVLSPDGRFIAYASNTTGRDEVYVQPYPGPGPTIPVSTEGGTEPLWSPDGREFFYRDESRVMAVDVIDPTTFAVGAPRVLFEGPFAPSPSGGVNYDISPDSQRFVMIEEVDASASRIHVITEWNEEVRRRFEEN